MRTIIDLQDKQIAALKELGEKTRLSRAELIRRAVNDYLAKNKNKPHSDAFGLWQNRDLDALEHQTKLRQEWNSDESIT